DGAKEGILANRTIILALASQPAVSIQVGGGVRSAEIIDDLLRHGVDRVVIGSAAVERQEEVASWFARFGAERLCLAFDVRLDDAGVPRLRTRGWKEASALSLWDAVEAYLPHGLHHVLCTDIARDGALTGPNVDLY